MCVYVRVSTVLSLRYKIPLAEDISGEEFVHELAQKLFNGHIETAGARILRDYGKGSLGKFALELPPRKVVN